MWFGQGSTFGFAEGAVPLKGGGEGGPPKLNFEEGIAAGFFTWSEPASSRAAGRTRADANAASTS